jgi:hypothetical protein
MQETRLTVEEQQVLKELEAEEKEYEEVEYLAVTGQEEEKARFQAIVDENIKRKKVINIRTFLLNIS